jgi:hypothetical protein
MTVTWDEAKRRAEETRRATGVEGSLVPRIAGRRRTVYARR